MQKKINTAYHNNLMQEPHSKQFSS